MKTYTNKWRGLDRGHEGYWTPSVWFSVIRAIGELGPCTYLNPKSPLYEKLSKLCPDSVWVSTESTGETRTLFRDAREPWTSLDVLDFNQMADSVSLTKRGYDILSNKTTYREILGDTLTKHEENGEYPFSILSEAFLQCGSYTPITLNDALKIMLHYRKGDDLLDVLNLPDESLPTIDGRRVRAMLLLLCYSGAIIQIQHSYYAASQDILSHINNCNYKSVIVNTFSRPDILAAIRTKPFILLAGISGTGKSRMVRQLARGCCPRHKSGSMTEDHPLYNEQKPGNFEMIPVRPNWHDSSQLLGYESRVSGKAEFIVKPFVRFLCKAWRYEKDGIPFFLCLDEMNLAPVEQYFAEYLSVIESRKTVGGKIVTDPLIVFKSDALLKQVVDECYAELTDSERDVYFKQFKENGGIPIPRNFIVMGTVNMDETTFSFSRKVLDRAMSFELNEVNMDNGLEKNPDIDFGTIGTEAATCAFTQGHEVYAVAKDNCDKIKGFLVDVNKVLDQTPFKIAYRTRNEIMIYCHERMKDGTPLAQALDEATSMKILSRVEGDKRRLVVRDKALAAYDGKGLLESLLDVILEGLKAVRGGETNYTESAVCSTKLKEMIGQLENGYTSFWTR